MNNSSTWPPPNGLGSPTVPRDESVFVSAASIVINAPASVVFDVVCNTSAYPQWNEYVPSVEIHEGKSSILEKGTSFTYNVVMDLAKPSKITPTQLRVTDVSTPEHPSDYISSETLADDPSYTSDLSTLYRISWKSEGGFVSMGLKTERFHEIIARGENECEVRTWEVFGGLLAYTVKFLFKKRLSEWFMGWCKALKKGSEEKAAATN
jgi:hypothetical protein